MPSNLLVVGASGLVGRALLRRCAVAGVRPRALTREPRPPDDLADLAHWYGAAALSEAHPFERDADTIDTVISAGPLDVLARWLQARPLPALRRVAALSSTSVVTKPDSLDPAERDVARRLAEGEQQLIAACGHAGATWTVLRPTLIWGEGRDRNVSRLAAIARRQGRLVLPVFARGLRQPIRADDVAAALLAAIERPQAANRCLDLPGGETLPYHEMASRIASAVSPSASLWRLPVPAAVITVAARLRLLSPGTSALLKRMGRDLVFDGAPARAALGIVPAGFDPRCDDFPPL
jgi:uncharacterized protein YbjT (DUF2867 family)